VWPVFAEMDLKLLLVDMNQQQLLSLSFLPHIQNLLLAIKDSSWDDRLFDLSKIIVKTDRSI